LVRAFYFTCAPKRGGRKEEGNNLRELTYLSSYGGKEEGERGKGEMVN